MPSTTAMITLVGTVRPGIKIVLRIRIRCSKGTLTIGECVSFGA